MAVDQSFDRSALRQLFDACDPSGSGFISKQSLLDGCQRLQLDDLTAENVDVLFAELATDDGAACQQISFEAFVERFTAWATQQNDEIDGVEQGVTPRPRAEEEFVGVSDNAESYGGTTTAATSIVVSRALGESDLAELVRRFDADTSGVSLRNALVTKWSVPEQHAFVLTGSLNSHMSEANIRQVLCESLRELGLDVDVPTAMSRKPLARLEPSELYSQSPDQPRRSPMAYERSPAPSPGLKRRGSSRRSVHVSRNVSLEDANIGDLKYDGEVRQLWENMKATQPELLDGFASFLDGVSQQLKDAEQEKEQLKTDLDRGAKDLDERAMQLDEEASHQIELAKAKVKAEERNRIQHIKEELEREVQERDKKLETAMDNLNGLQLEVQKLMAKDKTKKSQYEEMEQMKLELEKALDAQKQKHNELEQLLASSSGQESPTRPQSATRLSGSEHELMSRHLDSLHSYSSDHRSHQAAAASSPSPFSHGSKARSSASKYTSDEDALSGRLGHRAYSPRSRRSGSFRRSGKRPKLSAGSPRLVHDGSAVRKPSAAAAEFGDDEGSPTRGSPGIGAKARPAAAVSSDSDSDLQVDEQQALPTTLGRHRSGRPSFTDTEAMRSAQRPVMVVRRTSLSPEDLVPGYGRQPADHAAAAESGSDSDGVPCDTGHTPVIVRRGADCVVSTPVRRESLLAAVQGEKLSAIMSTSPPEVFSPPVEIVIAENGEVSSSPLSNDFIVSSGEQRVIPLASVPPMQEEASSHAPGKPVKGRSMSMRVKSGPPRRQPKNDDASKAWAAKLGDRLDLVSSKPVSMPAVVHPIKAQPPKHSTLQFPITEDLVNEVGGVIPDRVFKVVFCGDSGVGKTSYIWRICNQDGDFQPGNFSSTIGVDFQTRLFDIEGQQTVLQLWDTAGQERFRTFTKQYFRKADGVILMYDICNDQSFLNVREWMQQIQDATGDSTAIMLLGNKVDLADMRPKPRRQVTYWQAQQLAQQSSALFAEVSARSGHYVRETCMEMGKVLLAAEKDTMEGLLKLDPAGMDKPVAKKKSCCD